MTLAWLLPNIVILVSARKHLFWDAVRNVEGLGQAVNG